MHAMFFTLKIIFSNFQRPSLPFANSSVSTTSSTCVTCATFQSLAISTQSFPSEGFGGSRWDLLKWGKIQVDQDFSLFSNSDYNNGSTPGPGWSHGWGVWIKRCWQVRRPKVLQSPCKVVCGKHIEWKRLDAVQWRLNKIFVERPAKSDTNSNATHPNKVK